MKSKVIRIFNKKYELTPLNKHSKTKLYNRYIFIYAGVWVSTFVQDWLTESKFTNLYESAFLTGYVIVFSFVTFYFCTSQFLILHKRISQYRLSGILIGLITLLFHTVICHIIYQSIKADQSNYSYPAHLLVVAINIGSVIGLILFTAKYLILTGKSFKKTEPLIKFFMIVLPILIFNIIHGLLFYAF